MRRKNKMKVPLQQVEKGQSQYCKRHTMPAKSMHTHSQNVAISKTCQ